MTEHTRRLKHLNDHLKDLGSWQHRKKNPCDPLANPVWFFKGKNRDADLEKALDLSNYDKQIKKKYWDDRQQYEQVMQTVGALTKSPPRKAYMPPTDERV